MGESRENFLGWHAPLAPLEPPADALPRKANNVDKFERFPAEFLSLLRRQGGLRVSASVRQSDSLLSGRELATFRGRRENK